MKAKNVWKFVRPNLNLLIPLLLLIPLYAVLYKIYIPRVNAFGCFDDCNNFMGGYFLLQGKHIFSDFFFNHQPFAAFISYIIQSITHPQNIYELVLRHRQFVLLFSLIANALLIIRFRTPAGIFIVIYELSKFYLFGDRFLAEGMIVYTLVYLAGLAMFKFSNHRLLAIDYLLFPIAAWFVIFMREPYIPISLVLLVIILFDKKINRTLSLGLFILLLIATLLSFNLKEYFFNVVTVNYLAVLPSDITTNMFGNRFIQAFFYPIYIFFYGKWNILRQLLVFIDIIFLVNMLVLIKNKSYRTAIIIFLILGLANIRVVLPGSMFYEAFHMLIWFALFIFTTAFLVFLNNKRKFLFYGSIAILFIALFSFISSKSYFTAENYNQQAQFLEYFGEDLQIGEVVRGLSKPGDTLFLDASDDLIYWQAKIPSPYKYTWYTSAMPAFAKYADARIEMFKVNAPTFYKEYGSCPKKVDVGPNYRLPDFVKDDYVRLNNLNKPSCLFVRRDKIEHITSVQWQKAAEFLYHR